jgi:hypothetical protein
VILLVLLVVGYLVWSGKGGNMLRSLATKSDSATEKLHEAKDRYGSPMSK